MRGWLVAVVVFSALAGCSDGKEAPAGDESPPGTFTLRGVVVDPAIVPVQGADIRMGDRNTTTDTEGAFQFIGVEPGFHVLHVSMQGYLDEIVQVGVAHDEAPGTIKVQLKRNPEDVRYVESFVIEGFVECGTYTAPYSFAACGTANVGSVILCSTSGGAFCFGNVTGDRYITIQRFDTRPDFMNIEMVWDSTQPTGDRLRILVGSATPEQLEAVGSSVYNESTGASPLLATMDREDLLDSGIGDDAYFLSQTFATRSELAPCVADACLGVGATVQQEFELFFHLFYGYQPPAGWRFTDGTPVPGG